MREIAGPPLLLVQSAEGNALEEVDCPGTESKPKASDHNTHQRAAQQRPDELTLLWLEGGQGQQGGAR